MVRGGRGRLSPGSGFEVLSLVLAFADRVFVGLVRMVVLGLGMTISVAFARVLRVGVID